MPFLLIGITISDCDFDEHAMCPSNSFTFGTTIVLSFYQLVPHTPCPLKMFVHAAGPWNGPRTSLGCWGFEMK